MHLRSNCFLIHFCADTYSLSLSLESAAHPTTGTVHGGELLARNQREVLRARGRTLREDEDEVEEKKEGGEGGGEGGFG